MGERDGEPGCLHITAPAEDGELVADRCWLLGATAIGTVEDRIEVGFLTAGAAAGAARWLGEWRSDLRVVEIDAGPALDAALEAWKPFARPLRVGRLHVRPSWLDAADDPPSAGERAVVLDPTRAFGYDHPSTLACLEQVERRAGPGCAVLDVGCGSGILAVAAAVLGAGPVVAIDTDRVALAATERSAAAAGVVVSCGTDVDEVDGRFDLVVANIGSRTLRALAPSLVARVAAGGNLVLAGLLAEQVPAVVAAYEAEGLVLEVVGEREGWASPVFLRKSTTSGS